MDDTRNKDRLEIIPISDSTNHKSNRMPYMSDRMIVPRVQKYLESHGSHIDLNVMADDLQAGYREYARLKRNAFRASVKKAYQVVLQNYGLEEQDSSSSDDDDDDSEDSGSRGRKVFAPNTMDNQIMDLYHRPAVVSKQIDENVLIDISSDDSEAPQQSYKPSTSIKEPQAVSNNNNTSNNINNKRAAEKINQTGGIKRKGDALSMQHFQTVTKKKKSLATLHEPSIMFKDIGGMDKILQDVCKLLIHVRHPEVYRQIGISPPRGFLLHGPPGCGKTLLANAIAGEMGVPLLKVAAPELVGGVSGESEERIRGLFERAMCSTPCILFIDEIDAITPNRQNAQKEMERRIVAQLLTCLDDLSQSELGDRVLVIGATNRPDSIDPALRRAGRFDREICLGIPDLTARKQILKVLTQKLKLSENFDFDSLAKFTPGYVGADLMSLTREAAMAAVNRMFNTIKEQRVLNEIQTLKDAKVKEAPEIQPDLNSSDPEIIVDDEAPKATEQRDGGNENAIVVIDDESSKAAETSTAVASITAEPINGHLSNKEAPLTETLEAQPQTNPTSTPLDDLMLWLHSASPLSSDELSSLCITMDDFAKALKCVQPSAKREGFATVPDVTWEDVGSLTSIKEELQMAILAPVKHTEKFKELGLMTPTGVLLCGPPGCGKTLLAKAIANEAGINFISVKGPELLNMYVGESERAIRVCFERARNSAPCVIFFDELDAICPKRSDSREGGPTMRVVNQMLTEMDGVQERQGVFLLAASNRPDIIDPAVLRPGRLDKILFVGLPTPSERVAILLAITKNGTQPRLTPDVDLEAIGSSEQCRGYTGADLAALVREAGMIALKEYMLIGDMQLPLMVNTEHFQKAVAKIRPSVPEKDQKHYEKLRKLYSAVPENDVEEMEYS